MSEFPVAVIPSLVAVFAALFVVLNANKKKDQKDD